LFGVFALTTNAIAPAAGEVLVARAGFDALFLAAAGCALAGAALSLLAPTATSRPRELIPTSLLGLLSRRPVLVPVALSGLLATGFGAAITFVTALGVERALPGVALFFVGHVAASLAMRILLGWLPDRVGHRRAVIPAALVLASGLAVLSTASGPETLLLAGLLFGSGHAVTYPSLQALVIGRVDDASRGRVLGVYSGAFAVGMMASSFVYGVIAEHAGYTPMYLVAALTVTVGVLVFAVVDRD